VSIAVLWLHYRSSLQTRRLHEVDIVRLSKLVVGVVVLELLLPKGVYEVRLEVVWSVLYESGFFALLADFGIALAECIQMLFFGRLDNEGINIDGPVARSAVSPMRGMKEITSSC
jgi:hypothetical protein